MRLLLLISFLLRNANQQRSEAKKKRKIQKSNPKWFSICSCISLHIPFLQRTCTIHRSTHTHEHGHEQRERSDSVYWGACVCIVLLSLTNIGDTHGTQAERTTLSFSILFYKYTQDTTNSNRSHTHTRAHNIADESINPPPFPLRIFLASLYFFFFCIRLMFYNSLFEHQTQFAMQNQKNERKKKHEIPMECLSVNECVLFVVGVATPFSAEAKQQSQESLNWFLFFTRNETNINIRTLRNYHFYGVRILLTYQDVETIGSDGFKEYFVRKLMTTTIMLRQVYKIVVHRSVTTSFSTQITRKSVSANLIKSQYESRNENRNTSRQPHFTSLRSVLSFIHCGRMSSTMYRSDQFDRFICRDAMFINMYSNYLNNEYLEMCLLWMSKAHDVANL